MKALTILVAALCIGAAHSVKTNPYRVRVLNESTVSSGPFLRIYGGREAAEGQFPYMVIVLINIPGVGLTQCSGSLIQPDWVLVGAHCVYSKNLRPADILVAGGKVNLRSYALERMNMKFSEPIDEEKFQLQEIRAKQFVYHPKYDPELLVHDVALIQLQKPFDLKKMKYIPVSSEEMTEPKNCTILGWGLVPGHVQPVKLNYVENRRVSTVKIGCQFKKEGAFICLAPDNSGICQGDSGSPLVCDNKIWGVASHFVTLKENPGCSESLEEYYTELYPDVKWIAKYTGESGSGSGSGSLLSSLNLIGISAAVLFSICLVLIAL